MKYDIISLDVWGNEEDGWQVNDSYIWSKAVEFPTTHKVFNQGTEGEFSTDEPSDQQILDTLIEIGFLHAGVMLADIGIEGESDNVLYIDDAENSRPICQLRRVEG